jgi:PleD family two-component response regulator
MHGALKVAKIIYKKTFSINLKIHFNPNISIGLAEYKEENIDDFSDKLDKALYKAKNNEEIKIVIA